MKLTKEEVRHVATLARLGLSEAEVEKFQGQLSGILDYVEQLKEVSTDGVEPTAQVTGLTNVLRKDELGKPENLHGATDFRGVSRQAGATGEALLKCSPLPEENNQIKVKNVF